MATAQGPSILDSRFRTFSPVARYIRDGLNPDDSGHVAALHACRAFALVLCRWSTGWRRLLGTVLTHKPSLGLAGAHGSGGQANYVGCAEAQEGARGTAQRRRAVRLYLIRHAQSIANQNADLVGGHGVMTPLTETGETQAKLLGQRLHGEGVAFDGIFASHAVRARRTAELASAELAFNGNIEEESRVVEFCQGDLEKKRRADVYAEDGPVKRGICRDGNLFYRPPGWSPEGVRGESAWDTEVRYTQFIDELLDAAGEDDPGHQELVVAIFSHGMTLKASFAEPFPLRPLFL